MFRSQLWEEKMASSADSFDFIQISFGCDIEMENWKKKKRKKVAEVQGRIVFLLPKKGSRQTVRPFFFWNANSFDLFVLMIKREPRGKCFEFLFLPRHLWNGKRNWEMDFLVSFLFVCLFFFCKKIPLSLLRQLSQAEDVKDFLRFVDNATLVVGHSRSAGPFEYVVGSWENEGIVHRNQKEKKNKQHRIWKWWKRWIARALESFESSFIEWRKLTVKILFYWSNHPTNQLDLWLLFHAHRSRVWTR